MDQFEQREKEDFEKEFRINNYITLKLERNQGDKITYIYINSKRFRQCIRLVIEIPKEHIEKFDEINSIDEAAEIHDKFLIENTVVQGKNATRMKNFHYNISPEEEFQGHCSNLQAWYEYNYDTRLIHSNLAFPLLRKLVEVGDITAKKVYKEEIATRLSCNSINVRKLLISENYLDCFNREELIFLIDEIIDLINNIDDEGEKLEEITLLLALGLKFLDKSDYNFLYQKLKSTIYNDNYNDMDLAENLVVLSQKCKEITNKGISFLLSKLSELLINIKNPSESLGRLLLDYHMYDEALIVAEKLLQSDERNYYLINGLARAYERDKQYWKSIELYNKILKVEKKNIFILANLAEVYVRLFKSKKAIKLYKKALRIDPTNVEILMHLADFYSLLQKYSKTISTYKKALTINSELATLKYGIQKFELWYKLGLIYKDKGNLKEALSCFMESSRLKPGYLLNLGEAIKIFLQLDNREWAINTCEFALIYDPSFSIALNVYIDYLLEKEDYENAINRLKRALSKTPYHKTLYNKTLHDKNIFYLKRLGNIYLRMGEHQEAYKTFKQIELYDLSYDSDT